ncbi:MAG TPA: cobalt transporter CbiM [Terriglobales bacterium]|nr:cobalt transporter CbiM [Terriglobales bacterium]
MHIPDGYLSPATCAALYAAASPFWCVSLQRVKKLLNTRMVPLLSLSAAFSFVVMMFNLPLPGGTTGHATGVAVSAIVLGPWASMLAISVALIIQAVFFGDGGITAIGANCFNIAIIGSLVAYGVYRVISAGAAFGSRRRFVAAAIAGYASINVAAFITAIEFGIQPALFRDATGTPLYAPYGLSVTIPAMMLGHVTFAGVAEALLTAGVLGYLQRTRPALLAHRLTGRPSTALANEAGTVGWRSLKPLVAGLALLLLLTPLGVLAVGTAWGEWSAEDFASVEGRNQIAAVSGNQAPPATVPSGLQRLSSVWTAPFPDYAPPMVKHESFGYVLSGMFGVGLVTLATMALGGVLRFRGAGAHREA